MTGNDWLKDNQGKPAAFGVTVTSTNLPLYYQTTHGSTVIDVYRMSSPEIYILDTVTPNSLAGTSVTMHEFGHALGYSDHSQTQTELMYPESLMLTGLTDSERNHLRQIYDIG